MMVAIAYGWVAAISAALVGSPEHQRIDRRIENGRIVGETRAIRVTEGDKVTIRWAADEAVSIHFHGYDVELEAKPGAPADMTFEAPATDRFSVSVHGLGGRSHDAEATPLYIEVYPR